MSHINGRGTIKWTSLMMPEHVQMLNDYWKQQEWKEEPILDEQQKEYTEMKLQLAIYNDLTFELTYFQGHDFQNIKGKLDKVDNRAFVFRTLAKLRLILMI
ncbi:YolD-like family protein [Lentibacillus sp. CBA3610]|uniref:YolD-like family protein n=1 Tax=Lentibacillus sp. CBA3610 TaxID=2518176 RepID=UPI0015952FF0|nr:YolD-like family protein [Lentibacillus sp. CBA3610]QKY71657.1 YolD-like family protein [Lentibacillus sp. CBA3610]